MKRRMQKKLGERIKAQYMIQLREENPEYTINKERIRTYHEPRNEVKDHRTGEVYKYDDVVGTGKAVGKMIQDSTMHQNKGDE